MKTGLYARLAWTGMVKNRRLYLPYLLSCTGMVLMFYILMGLSGSPLLSHMSGGGSSAIILRLGTVVIAVFSLLFLFYTHSFLIRRREREFGLYNVLGMGKGNIARILLWETAITYGVTAGAGLILGVVLYKLAELGLVRLLRDTVTYTLSVSVSSLLVTAALFAVIQALILLNSLRQLHTVNAIALLRSENVGDRPPRAKWVLTLAGVVLLGGAYWLAVSIREPLAALLWFFAAVIMVIIATYLLFISGSVTLCKGLQNNKHYYYDARHFVSVSSMAYRMKRNGAGLASVCILATMVLVMLSSTTCLYVGQEDAVNARYPHDLAVTVYDKADHPLDEAEAEVLRQGVEDTVFNFGGKALHMVSYRTISISGVMDGSHIRMNTSGAITSDTTHITQVHFLPLEDYNASTGQSLPLEDGQVYVAALRTDFPYDTLSIDGECPAERVFRGGCHAHPDGDRAGLHPVRGGIAERTQRGIRLVSRRLLELRLRYRPAGKPTGGSGWRNAKPGGRTERVSQRRQQRAGRKGQRGVQGGQPGGFLRHVWRAVLPGHHAEYRVYLRGGGYPVLQAAVGGL